MSERRFSSSILLCSLLMFLGAALVYPVWLTIEGGFRSGDGASFTLDHVQAIFTTPRLIEGLVNSLLIAIGATSICLVIALPLAVIHASFAFPGRRILGALVLVPLILPPFVGAIGMNHIFGRAGAVNTALIEWSWIDTGIDFIGRGGFWAVIVVEALHLYPILFLNLASSLATIDPSLDEAACNLGAGRWRRFTTVTLPLARPGLFAGGAIVFIWAFTELGAPLMFEYHRVTPVQIFGGIREMNTRAEPYALTMVMLAVSLLVYVLGRGLVGRSRSTTVVKGARARTRRPLGFLPATCATAFFAFVTFVAMLPHVGVILASVSESGAWYRSIVPTSFSTVHYESAMTHPLSLGSIRNSLGLAAAAVGIDLVIGVAIAFLLVRTRARGRLLLDALSMLPLAVPGLVMAFGYVAATLRWPCSGGMPEWLASCVRPVLPEAWFDWLDHAPLERWADVLGADPNPIPLLILAFAVRRLPYVVRSAAAGFEQTAVDFEEASRNLGAGRLQTLRRITTPLIGTHLLAGALLAFSFAMLEVSDSLILAQREKHFPITKAIYALTHRLGDGPNIAAAMGVWCMLLLAATMLATSLLVRRRSATQFGG